MRKNVKRLAGLASIGVLLAVVGCDKAESDATKHDKKIANILDQGQRTLNQARLKLGDAALKSMDARWRAAEAESLKASGQTLSPDQLRQRIPSLPDDAARRLSSPEILAQDAQRLEEQARKLSFEGQGLLKQAQDLLKQAAMDTTASASLQAHAKAVMAQSEMESGVRVARELPTLHLDARQAINQIEQLARRVADNRRLSELLAHRDPAKPGAGDASPAPFKVIADIKTVLEKGPAAEGTDPATDPRTLDALNAAITQQDAKIKEKQASIEDLKTKKADAQGKAVEHLRKSQTLKGKEGYAEYEQGHKLNEQAALMARDIDVQTSELLDLQRVREQWDARREGIKQTLAALDVSSAGLSENWKAVEAAKASLDQQTAAIIGPSASADDKTPTILDLCKQLSLTLKSADEKRAAAVKTMLKAARKPKSGESASGEIGLFEQARTQAVAANAAINKMIVDPKNAGSPRIKVWKEIMATGTASQFALANGRALESIGDLYADEAALLSAKADMLKALADAKVEAPADLAAGRALADARNDATEYYGQASTSLAAAGAGNRHSPDPSERARADSAMTANLAPGADPLATAAQLAQMFIDYRTYQLMGGGADAEKYLNSAKFQYDLVARAAPGGRPLVLLPGLPADLEGRGIVMPTPPTSPTPAAPPTTTPATAPTTSPDSGSAPPPPDPGATPPPATAPAPDPAVPPAVPPADPPAPPAAPAN